MPMLKFDDEKQYQQALEQALIKEFGWIPYKIPNKLGPDTPILRNVFLSAIKKIDTNKPILSELKKKYRISDDELDEILYSSFVEALKYDQFKFINEIMLSGKFKIKINGETYYTSIIWLDKEEQANNSFHFAREMSVQYKKNNARLDFLFFINGVPVVNLETKIARQQNNGTKIIDWTNAFDQIINYKKFLPFLYKMVLIGVAATQIRKDNHSPVYFSPLNLSHEHQKLSRIEKRKLVYKWHKHLILPDIDPKEEYMYSKELPEILQFLGFLHPAVLWDLFRDYIFVYHQGEHDNSQTKIIIPYYMQYRAVSKTINAMKSDTRNGVIWHWQGTGKTYTMAWIMKKAVSREKLVDKAWLEVDRRALERQAQKELYEVLGSSMTIINRAEDMKKFMVEDTHYYAVSTIHKASNIIEDICSDIKNSHNKWLILVDEAHRTQKGKMANKIRSCIKNAYFFAFTGTPDIWDNRRGTNVLFGEVIDRFFIDESTKEGFVLEIEYRPALPEYHIETETIEKVMNRLENELESITDPDILDSISEREIKKIIRQNKNVHQLIVEHLLNAFIEFYNQGLKGMLTVYSREAAVEFCQLINQKVKEMKEKGIAWQNIDDKELDKFCAVVITYKQNNDTNSIISHMNQAFEIWNVGNIDEYEKVILDKFVHSDHAPYLLVVVNKLTTGFDAPRLGVVFINNILTKHSLLQLIARTNRRYKDKKKGVVYDYVGVIKYLQKVFDDYNKNKNAKRKIKVFEQVNNEDIINEKISDLENILKQSYILQYVYENMSPNANMLEFISENEQQIENEIKSGTIKLYQLRNSISSLLGLIDNLSRDKISSNILQKYRRLKTVRDFLNTLITIRGKKEKELELIRNAINEAMEIKGIKELESIDISKIQHNSNSNVQFQEKIKSTLETLNDHIEKLLSKISINKQIKQQLQDFKQRIVLALQKIEQEPEIIKQIIEELKQLQLNINEKERRINQIEMHLNQFPNECYQEALDLIKQSHGTVSKRTIRDSVTKNCKQYLDNKQMQQIIELLIELKNVIEN